MEISYNTKMQKFIVSENAETQDLNETKRLRMEVILEVKQIK